MFSQLLQEKKILVRVGVVCLGLVFRSFRFDGELYAGFVGVCGALVVVYAN